MMWINQLSTLAIFCCLAFHIDAFGSDQKMPENPPDAPAAPKYPPDSDFKDSEVCTDKMIDCFNALAKSLQTSEPFEMKDMKPCGACLISMLSTIRLKESKVVRIAAQDNGDKPESVFYILIMEFLQIKADCSECVINYHPKDLVGGYIGTWKNAEIELRMFKQEWNGEAILITQSKVLNKLDPAMVDMECKGDDQYKDVCAKAHNAGTFAGIFYSAASVCFTTRSNQEFAADSAQAEKESSGSKSMAKMACCNKDDVDR